MAFASFPYTLERQAPPPRKNLWNAIRTQDLKTAVLKDALHPLGLVQDLLHRLLLVANVIGGPELHHDALSANDPEGLEKKGMRRVREDAPNKMRVNSRVQGASRLRRAVVEARNESSDLFDGPFFVNLHSSFHDAAPFFRDLGQSRRAFL